MLNRYENVKIRGIVTALPDHFVSNREYAVGEEQEKIKKQIRVTGIQKRPVCVPGQRAADLCIAAGRELMDRLHWNPDEIDCLLFISSYASYKVPCTAFFIRKELNIREQCLVFDINLACSGFVAGLQTIGGLFCGRKMGTKALLFVSDTTSESVNGQDPATRILFGDAGAAIALEKSPDAALLFRQKSDGDGYADLLRVDGSHEFVMNGMAVFEFSIGDVVQTVKEFLEECREENENPDWYFIHQAQKFIVDKVTRFAGIDPEKVPVTYDQYGNTGCASIPLTICLMRERLVQSGRTKIFLCGFGGGHSWGCAITTITRDAFLEIIRTNEIFPDGKQMPADHEKALNMQ